MTAQIGIWRFVRISLILLLAFSCSMILDGKYGYKPDDLPTVITESDLEDYESTLKNMDRRFAFSGQDFRGKDLSGLSLDFLSKRVYDNHTTWPEVGKLPEGFIPGIWLERGMDPGLGVRDLHKKGITGKGISVAVIDKYISPDHSEFRDRIHYIKITTDAKWYQYRNHYHDIACASILCGEKSGVAPGATLYYFAVPDDRNNAYNFCVAMEELIRINERLPRKEKIRVVSISNNVNTKDESVSNRWARVYNQAKKDNIAVIYSDLGSTHAVFTWGGCPPFKRTIYQ